MVIFLKAGKYPKELKLGADRRSYLAFRYLDCSLAELPMERYLASDNLVARLNLPNMRYDPADKIRAYAYAIRGLLTLEPDLEKQIKYLDFIDIYTRLDDNEQEIYRRDYPQEAQSMVSFAERFKQEGIQKGIQQGIEKGVRQGIAAEHALLLRQIRKRFGADCARRTAPLLETITDPEQLAEIGEWILDAEEGAAFLQRLGWRDQT